VRVLERRGAARTLERSSDELVRLAGSAYWGFCAMLMLNRCNRQEFDL
jgi:hypothetical protein